MKKPRRPTKTVGLSREPSRFDSTSGGFTGTSNPRHLRAIHALMRRAMPREQLDREAGCSNGPDLVSDLRERGLDIPCHRVECFDRDHRPVTRGVYALTSRDRVRLARWIVKRDRAAGSKR
ncbi:MAG: hypothetical protein U1E86_07615 [Burkholderiaceae bacterium]